MVGEYNRNYCALCNQMYLLGTTHNCPGRLSVQDLDAEAARDKVGQERQWTQADPDYYRGVDKSYDAIDVISNFKLDFDLGCAVKYILRAGKKPGNTFLTDLKKALRVLERRVEREEGKTKTVR